MKSRKLVRKKNQQSRDFNEQELGALMYASTNEKFNFSEYDLELVKNPDTPKSSKAHNRAEVVIKKIKSMQKSYAKQQWKLQEGARKAQDSPFLTKVDALRSLVSMKEGQELGAAVEVIVELCIKHKLFTQKQFDKLTQERLLEGRHPDPCPKCEALDEKGRCTAIFQDADKALLAKEHYPDLTGAKAKRVIACPNFKQKKKEPKDEKKNDAEESSQDNQ